MSRMDYSCGACRYNRLFCKALDGGKVFIKSCNNKLTNAARIAKGLPCEAYEERV